VAWCGWDGTQVGSASWVLLVQLRLSCPASPQRPHFQCAFLFTLLQIRQSCPSFPQLLQVCPALAWVCGSSSPHCAATSSAESSFGPSHFTPSLPFHKSSTALSHTSGSAITLITSDASFPFPFLFSHHSSPCASSTSWWNGAVSLGFHPSSCTSDPDTDCASSAA
jgi:hypothetical protein